jgi:hypothetical protein
MPQHLATLERRSVERGWCEACGLPSLLTGPVLLVTDHGVTEAGTWRHCTEHDREPEET